MPSGGKRECYEMNAIHFSGVVVACSALLSGAPVSAADALRSYVASPDIYRVVTQDQKTRMVLMTLKPGQRDVWHSHPATAAYFLTDCDVRVHTPEGNYSDRFRKEGFAYLTGPIPSHSFENRGSMECRMLIVELEP